MKVPLVLVSVAIVIAVAVFGRVGGDGVELVKENEARSSVDNPGVEGVDDEQVEDVSDIQDSTPTTIPTPSFVPRATMIPNTTVSNSDYIYPGASVISDSEGELHLQSNFGTDEITEWYQAKLKSLGMNVNTSVKTQANEKVLNKLVASSADTSIGVEISKENGSSLVIIIVTL